MTSDVQDVNEMEQISAWMQEHNLPKKMQTKLLEEEVTLDVLLISDEEDIRGLCKEFNLNRLATMKLLAAIKKMPDANLNKKSKIIIMDLQEKNAMTKTEIALTTLQTSLKSAQTGVETLVANATQTEEQVRASFAELRQRINKREETLLARAIEVRDKQTECMRNDKVRFEKYIELVKNAIKLQHELFEQNLTAEERKQKVIDYKNDAIDPNFNYDLTENEDILFAKAFETELNGTISRFGLIDGCFKVRFPNVTAFDVVQRNNLSVSWTLPKCEAVLDKFEIQHSTKETGEMADWTVLQYAYSADTAVNPADTDEAFNYVITGLGYKTAFFVRVRGSNKYGFGPYSSTKQLTTLAEPVPNEPVWMEDFPALDGNLNITLKWRVNFDDEETIVAEAPATAATAAVVAEETKEEVKEEVKEESKEEEDANAEAASATAAATAAVVASAAAAASPPKIVRKEPRYSKDCEIVQFEVQYTDTVSDTWVPVFIDETVETGNTVTSHSLEKLTETTSFKMRVRCKNRVNQWSQWSPTSSIQTLLGISKHCFQWNEINPSPPAPINITMDGRRIEAPDASCWETFIGNNTAMKTGKHIWKMKWNKFGGSYQAMAIVTNIRCVDVPETNHRFNNNTTKYGRAYYWHRDGKKVAYGEDGTETDLKTSIDKWQTGDVITMHLDLDVNTLRFERGETEIGTFDVKPGFTWYPLMLMCTCGNEAESVPLAEW